MTEKETIYQSPATDIVVREDRHRQKISRKPLDSLMDSIREAGQIQPGVCHYNEVDELELLVGERRLRACMVLQIPFKYYVKEEVASPFLLELIQLDENLQREDLDWRDEIKAKARLHTLLTEMHGEAVSGTPGGHTFELTAEHIGVKKSILQEDVTLAGFLEVPEVEASVNKTTAKKIVKRMIEQVQRHEQLTAALKIAEKQSVEDQAPLTEKARAEVKVKEMEAAAKRQLEGKPEPPKPETQLEQQLIYFNKRCLLGKMEERILSFADESFDIVCFDPPWGVEFDQVRNSGGGTKDYDDDPYLFEQKITEWIKLIRQKMKPDSHLYMFFGIVRHDFIYATLEEAGFETNRMPLIWHKKGAHVTRNPTIWPGRSYEPIAYARKGSKPLVKMGAPDVIQTPMPTPSIKDIHPSAKHPEIYRELLLRSASPSDTILDPMAGSGMFAVAAESLTKTLALNWFQIEIDSDYRNLQLINLTKGYEQIAKKEPEKSIQYSQSPLPDTWQELLPGTEQWMDYWRAHPEEQEAMAAYTMERKAIGAKL